MLRKLLSHAAIYGLAAQVPRLAGVLALPILTQHLTSADYGVAGVVLAYTSALSMLQSLGLSVVMVNSFARYPIRFRWIWRQLHGFVGLWSLAYGMVMGVILFFVVPPEAAENRLMIALSYCLPNMLFSSSETQTTLYYQLSQRPFPIALRSFVVGACSVALNILTIAHLKMGYMGWFYTHFLAQLLSFFFNGYYLYVRERLYPIYKFKWSRIKASLKVSLPVIPHSLSFTLQDTSDKLVLDVLGVRLQNIGLYNVASNFGSYFMIATNAIMQASSPFYARYYAKRDDYKAAILARKMTFALQIIFLLATTLGCLWMKEIFQVLIQNKELQRAYPLAIIIVMGYNFRPMYNAAMSMLTYHEHTDKLWRISGVAAVGNIILNFVLVPYFGYQAAAFTTFIALMYLGYAGYFLKEYKQSGLVNYYPLVWLFLTIALSAVAYALSGTDLIYKVIITAIVATVALMLTIKYRWLLD